MALHNAGLDPSSLKLEITESMLMNADSAIQMLSQLKALGVDISIDDFGTGYSSLSYLHRLPFGNLKIDRSFVNSMSANKESFEIVRTIITLAQSLNLTIVAEGIETNEQLEMLRALKCEYGQGYFFSKALSVEWAASLLFANAIIGFAPAGLPDPMPAPPLAARETPRLAFSTCCQQAGRRSERADGLRPRRIYSSGRNVVEPRAACGCRDREPDSPREIPAGLPGGYPSTRPGHESLNPFQQS